MAGSIQSLGRLPARSYQDYTVGWICALPIEMAAARGMLDNSHESLPLELGDTNEYELGNIGPHNVVIACLGAYGTNNAAHVAAHMARSFPSLCIRLMVGIGGGAPGPEADLRLGDIVVGQRIMQYDLGKVVRGGKFQRTEIMTTLDPSLSTAISKMRAIHEAEQSAVPKLIDDMVEAHPKMNTYTFPAQAPDRLFVSEYSHDASLARCDECDASKLRLRPRRVNQDPKIHYGAIASGNSVIKDSATRDALAEELDIICFEMEAAGLLDHFKCLVVRGICDYCDSHKNKEWQRYAAAVAAAYAKELLLVIPAGKKAASTQRPTADEPVSRLIMPFTQNQDFVGRADILAQLQTRLDYSDFNRTWQPKVSLYGLGGIGKTQIAIQFGHWLRSTYPDVSVYWVRASSVDRFRQSFMTIAQECGIPVSNDPKVDVLSIVRDWLKRKENGRWLVILDNADDADLFIKQSPGRPGSGTGNLGSYIPECSHGGLLVTTRNKQAGSRLTRAQLVEVPKMELSECQVLLQTQLEGDDLPSAHDIDKLSQQLDFLPLAIAQAAAFLREQCMPVEEYLKLVDESLTDLLDEEFETEGRDEENPAAVAATWMISYQQIQRQNTLAGDLLSLSSLFDRQDIPREFMSNYYKRQNKGKSGSLEISKALGVLLAFSLIKEEHSGSFNMHRLVQLVTRKWLDNQGVRFIFDDEALLTVSELFPEGWEPENQEVCHAYLAHAQAVRDIVMASAEQEAARGKLLSHVGAYLQQEGRYKESERTLQDAYEIQARLLGKEHIDTLVTEVNLAGAFNELGKHNEAEEILTKVLKIAEMVLGKGHPRTLIVMGNLALTFQLQGRFEEAEKLETKALELRQMSLGPENAGTLYSMNNLAVLFLTQGHLSKSKELLIKCLETCRRVCGEKHALTPTVIGNLGSVFKFQGYLDKAKELLLEALELNQRYHGQTHPQSLLIMSALVTLFVRQGHLQEAEQWAIKTLEMAKKTLGEDHHATLRCLDVMAQTFLKQGRLGESEQLFRKILESRKGILGEKHHETLSTMNDLALTFLQQGRLEEAKKTATKALEIGKDFLGEEAPSTLYSMETLAQTLFKQGRLEEAEQLEMTTLESRKRILGEENPDTISSIIYLASIFLAQGRLEEAEQLAAKALEVAEQVPGKEIPLTLRAMQHLACCCYALDQKEKAKDLISNCIDLRKRVLGEDHPDTQEALKVSEDW